MVERRHVFTGNHEDVDWRSCIQIPEGNCAVSLRYHRRGNLAADDLTENAARRLVSHGVYRFGVMPDSNIARATATPATAAVSNLSTDRPIAAGVNPED